MKLNGKYRILLFILGASFIASCGKESDDTIVRESVSMGTTITIKAIHPAKDTANKAITEALKEIERINQKYSTYISDNFMASLNDPLNDTLIVDAETFMLLQKCDEIHKQTLGTFDAAIGNLIEIMGFEAGDPQLPPHDVILKTLDEVGWKHIELMHDSILIKHKHVTINFGGIAKGYAVDQACKILSGYNIESYMVNAGGEVRGYGKDWKIGIKHPRIENTLLGKIVLNNTSIATSGDYEQYFKKDDKRYSHIINPVTGLPSDESQSVSVIAENNIDADGLATGVFILGPEKGMEIIEKLNNIECLIVDNSGKIHRSSGIGKYLKEEN